MKKINNFSILCFLIFLHVTILNSQTLILNETLTTQESFNNFITVNVSGAQSWYCNAQYGYTLCSGYEDGESYDNEDWLITSELDLSEYHNIKLSFEHTRGNASVMNVGVAEGWYKVFATTHYTGDIETTQWTELQGVNHTLLDAWQWVFTGIIDIPYEVQSATTRIALRYMSVAPESATWEVKNMLVTGELPFPDAPNIFKITNWNTEWLGCTRFGPEDETLQIENVAATMLSINSDIYCMQEVTQSNNFPSINTLVALLGNEWGGAIVTNSTNNCAQNQGIIFRKSKVQLISSQLLNSGNAAEGNSYYYNWTSGRYPALYHLYLQLDNGTTFPLILINIHAKAEDGYGTSYIRRKGAAKGLKEILDGGYYQDKNIVIIGDFNDYLEGTTSSTIEFTESPYKNFIDDVANYRGVTKDITSAGPYYANFPLIEHTIISNELFDYFIPRSAVQEIVASQNIPNFVTTTSDHFPVSTLFQFNTQSTIGIQTVEYRNKTLQIYPNPVTNELSIENRENDIENIQIYDITGKKQTYYVSQNNAISVAHLKPGIYLIKMGIYVGKFVKN